MEGIPHGTNNQEKKRDPLLEDLWTEYDFRGHPPFEGSVAEKRLKEICDGYSNYLDEDKKRFSGDHAAMYGVKKISASESARREIHNQLAVMVVGRQRSGMDDERAREIANFAYEYSRGYKLSEDGKYEK